jgi:Fe-S cluster assembly protein SufD
MIKTITLTHSGTYNYPLSQEGSELEVIGRFWLKGDDKLDLNLTVIHAAKNTQANVSLKAVVEGRGVANLQGTIIVKKNAQNTNSFLEERVLLLSPNARATAIPNLEIEANQVKCSHAATVGKPSDEEIFYLQSRGLSERQATHLLAKGFLK